MRTAVILGLLGLCTSAVAGPFDLKNEVNYEAIAAGMVQGDQKIVNGLEVPTDRFPEVLSLAQVNTASGGTSGFSFCTGSLIHPQVVLTAAHCFDDVNPLPNNVERVAAWGQNINEAIDEWISLREVVLHPEYEPLGGAGPVNSGGMQNDIALLLLDRPKEGVPVMALNPDPVDGGWINEREVTFIGYGITSFEGSGGGIKRYTDQPLVVTSYDPFFVYTFNDGLSDTCQGDSGGPGVVSPTGTGYIQVGITSFGVGCGERAGGATRVDKHLSFDDMKNPDEAGNTSFIYYQLEQWEDAYELDLPIKTEPAAPPSFTCSHLLDPDAAESVATANVPFELKCRATATLADDEIISGVKWTWGDGAVSETDTEVLASHEYTEAGSYNLEMCMDIDGQLGTISSCARKEAYVRACDVPAVGFTYEVVKGLEVQFKNQTDLSVYECISDITWQVYEGESASGTPIFETKAWEPAFEFEERGTYTAVLHVGGQAGTGAAELTFDLKPARAGSCSTTGLGSMGMLTGLIGLVAVARRRRD